MEKFIYKYENKINHKIYIGQTNNLERRKREHLTRHSYYTSLIDRAIQKYGIENFNFEVIERTEDYNEREKYWINYYRSYKPYGYNICEGGGYLPNQQKENHSQAIITEEIARKIQEDLTNYSIPRRQITKKYRVTASIVENINSGHTWNYYGLKYPLRPREGILNKERAEKVINLLKSTSLSFKEIGQQVGWGESQISMINQGKNHPQSTMNYPIRSDPRNYEDKVESCINLLKEGKTNKQIADLLQVSAAWVSKINNGVSRKKENITYPIRK